MSHLHCVAGKGWGCWVLMETIFCRSLSLCIWPDSEPTKLLDHHAKQKTRRGGVTPQTDKHMQQSPFTGKCCKMTTFCIAFYQSNLSTPTPLISHYSLALNIEITGTPWDANLSKASPGYDQLIVDIDVQAAPLLVHQAQADMLPLGQRHQQGTQHVPLAEGFYPQLTWGKILGRIWEKNLAIHSHIHRVHTESGNRRFLAYILSWWKNLPRLVRGGEHAHPLSL